MALLSSAACPSLDILGLLQLGQETHRLREGKRQLRISVTFNILSCCRFVPFADRPEEKKKLN